MLLRRVPPKGDLHHPRDGLSEHKPAKYHQEPRLAPSDEALLKLFHLALRDGRKKWTMPFRNWQPALNRFTIQCKERMPPR